MKEFITPTLVDLDINETAEGVYAGSGASNPDPTVPPTPTEPPTSSGCWINWKCTWTGHNNGGHSVCHVSADHCGDHSGECLVMNFITNFNIADVKNASGYTISNITARSFTITRNNHFNASENIGFNFELVSADVFYDEANKPLHGAIGGNNAASYYCTVASYTCC